MLVGSGAGLVCIATVWTGGVASRPRRGSRSDRGATAPAASPGTCIGTISAASKEKERKKKSFAEISLFLRCRKLSEQNTEFKYSHLCTY